MVKTMSLPGGGTAYLVGRADPATCRCGRPRLPGESGCRDCMAAILDYLDGNVRAGLISPSRPRELRRKIAAAR